jgi:chromosome segregation ATPase
VDILDVDGFSTGDIMELLQSVVEKREGRKTVNEAVDEVRSTMNALSSSIDEIAQKLERRQFELPLFVERVNPLVERSQTQKRDEADADNLRWEITKKDENIVQLAKALKGLEDNISFLKIQVEREKKKNSKLGQQDSGSIVSSEQVQEVLAVERRKHDEVNLSICKHIRILGIG